MKIILFALTAFISLSILPLINITHNSGVSNKIDDLYKLDIVEGYFNQLIYQFGISTRPKQVIVGKENWLFLGNQYSKTISETINGGSSDTFIEKSNNVFNAQNAWDAWYKEHNVKEFKIIIGPNKSTIYPEFYPKWALPLDGNDKLKTFLLKDSDIYINVLDPINNSKGDLDLYFRTDTHWNKYGAAVAFKELMRYLKNSDDTLHTLKADSFITSDVKPRLGGDLSSFLKMQSIEHDVSPETYLTGSNKIEHLIINYRTNELLYKGSKPVGNMHDVLLIKTPLALNNRKVLWFSDSFGDSMGYYMTAMYSDVLKTHHIIFNKPEVVAELVKEWKPDLVFITTVERDAFGYNFSTYPPSTVGNVRQVHNTSKLVEYKFNNIKVDEGFKYVDGKDPWVWYKVMKENKKNTSIQFNFSCLSSQEIPLQVFWAGNNGLFSEKNSVRIKVNNGFSNIKIPKITSFNEVRNLRVDIDKGVKCNGFKLSDVELVS